jgi:hypothetical protein
VVLVDTPTTRALDRGEEKANTREVLAASQLDDLLARLPGSVRRGHAPSAGVGGGERLSTGIPLLDQALDGGFPRGRLSEIRGRGSAGTTSLLHRLAARATATGALVAWVDAADAFDPGSALAAGIALDRVLWTRPRDGLASFVATEHILVLGGFALVVLDVDPFRRPRGGVGAIRGGNPPQALGERGFALRARLGAERGTLWLRLARAAARSQSALVALCHGAGEVGSAAAVRLDLPPAHVLWDRSGEAPALLDGLRARIVVKRNRGSSGEQSLTVALG